MRKHLIWILAVLVLAFLGDRLLGFILKKITEKSQFRYSRLYKSSENADVLFIGNSRGLSFYQPEVERLTNLKTINLSYNGMPADLAKALVMDYLDRHQAPKIMVIDITMCDRYNEGLKSGFNLYTPFSERLTNLIKNSATVQHKTPTSLEVDTTDIFAGKKVFYGGQVSHLYRYNSEIFQRVLYHLKKPDSDWLIDRVIGTQTADEKDLKSYSVRMFPNMVAHMKEMVDYAKSKGVEVKLVINPYYPPFAATIRDSFLTPLKTQVERETGLSVTDFSTVLQAREEIGDYQHANKKGSIRYMQILTAEGFFGSGTIGYGENIKVETEETNYTNLIPSSVDSIKQSIDSQTVTIPETVVKTVSKTIKRPLSYKKKKYEDDWIMVDTLFSF